MKNINFNKYREWLNEGKEKLKGGAGDNKPDKDFDPKQLSIGVEDETGEHTPDKSIGKEIAKDHLSTDPDYYKKLKKAGLGEKKQLSKYWKVRAKKRAKRAGRGYPNNKDKSWAEQQQTKSESINTRISKLFEKELTIGEDISNNIDEFLKRIKEERSKLFNNPKPFGKNKKPKGSISVPLGPEYGGVAKGYKKKLSKLKKKGVVGVAPGETFGPMSEQQDIRTFGELKKVINGVMKKEIRNAAAGTAANFAIDQVLGAFPGAGNVKAAIDLFKSIYFATDDKKTNTFLDKINVDDKYSQIVDDKLEMAFLKYITHLLMTKADNEVIPDDFDINKELRIYLSNEYDNRTLTPVTR